VAPWQWRNGNQYQDTPDTLTTYSYAWWDAAQQAGISYKPDTSQGTTFQTTLNYDVSLRSMSRASCRT
jgi:hypothetical protein